MDLELEDLEMLLDALDALGSKGAKDDLMHMMLGGMLTKGKEESEKFFAEEQAKMEFKERERKLFSERIVLVKAKLIVLKDKATVRREIA